MKLRFRRSQQKEDVFASAVLNAGDTYDDSMAMFDAINLSGGEKKALRSLSVGMHFQCQLFQLHQSVIFKKKFNFCFLRLCIIFFFNVPHNVLYYKHT